MESQQNIVPPFDTTGYTAITGAQLLQLISGATPYANKGFVITTTDVGGNSNPPQAQTDTLLQNYLWIRQQPTTGLTTLYLWNPLQLNPTDSSLMYWNPIVFTSGIPAGSITNTMLAGGISAVNLAGGIQLSQLSNSSSYLLTNSVFAPVGLNGNVTGSFATGLVVAPSSILNSMLFSDTTVANSGNSNISSPNAPVSGNNIRGQTITLDKITPANTAGIGGYSTSGQVLTSNGQGQLCSWGTSLQKILQTVGVATTVASYYTATSSIGEILTTTAPTLSFNSGNSPIIGALQATGLVCGYTTNTTAGILYGQGGPNISLSFQPMLTTSFFLIEGAITVRCSTASIFTIALYGFDSGTGNYASVAGGVATFHGVKSTYSPMTNYFGGLCVSATWILADSVAPFQTVRFKFLASFNVATQGNYLSIVPFVGVTGPYNLGFNALSYNQNTGSSGTTPVIPIYSAATTIASYMTVQEIIIP